MKNLTYLLPCLLFGVTGFSQVGINTTNPSSTLDVNGTVRVRSLGQDLEGPQVPPERMAVSVLGLDEDGNFVKVTIGKNVDLINNEVIAIDRTLEMGDLPAPFNATRVSNASLAVLPGEPNHGRSIIKIINTAGAGDTEITGIEAAPDGTHIWLYAVSGKLELVPNSTESLVGNRIEQNDKMKAKQYEMIELFYDATRGKWIVMQNHS